MSTAFQPEMHLATLKATLRDIWAAGNYDFFSRFMEANAAAIVNRMQLDAGVRLLDVACGSGQIALLAARRGAVVRGCDIVPHHVVAAHERAVAEGLDCLFDEADAEDLPYGDESFDVVASVYWAMFAPRPELVTRELLRVCRSGGAIVMANWTREGFVGDLLAACAQFVAPSGLPSPLLWGDPEVVRSRFGGRAIVHAERRMCRFDYPLRPARVVDFYRDYYGPMSRAFDSLDAIGRQSLRARLVQLWTSRNLSPDPNRTMVDAEFLEVRATRLG